MTGAAHPVQHNLLDWIREDTALRRRLTELETQIDRLDDQGVNTTDLVEEYQSVQQKLL